MDCTWGLFLFEPRLRGSSVPEGVPIDENLRVPG